MRRYYVSDDQGNIRFTRLGEHVLIPIFANHGIVLSQLKTRRAYVLARLRIRPHFLNDKWFFAENGSTQSNPETRILLDMIFGKHTLEEAQRMLTKHHNRSLFSLVDDNNR